MQHLHTLSLSAIILALSFQITSTQMHAYHTDIAKAAATPILSQPLTSELSQLVAPLPAVTELIPVQYSKIPIALLDTQQPVDRVAALISSNEGGPTSIDWNDNGKGVSVGMFQANQRVGELPQLLSKLSDDASGRQALRNAFGDRLVAQIEADPTIIQRLNIKKNNWLGRGLKQLVHSESFQKLQVHSLRQKVVKAARVARKHGIKSNAGVAICADLTNQWGEGGARRFLRAAHTQNTEETKLKAIVDAVDNGSRYGERYKQDLQKAKANGLDFGSDFGV